MIFSESRGSISLGSLPTISSLLSTNFNESCHDIQWNQISLFICYIYICWKFKFWPPIGRKFWTVVMEAPSSLPILSSENQMIPNNILEYPYLSNQSLYENEDFNSSDAINFNEVTTRPTIIIYPTGKKTSFFYTKRSLENVLQTYLWCFEIYTASQKYDSTLLPAYAQLHNS